MWEIRAADPTHKKLSKEDEQAAEEVEVRREDQDKINKFSRLHQRELAMEEELKLKNVRSLAGNGLQQVLIETLADLADLGVELQKEKEELVDLSTELELADEDEKIQCVMRNWSCLLSCQANDLAPNRFKVGDAFFHVPLEEAQEMLEQAMMRIDDETRKLEESASTVRDEMQQLKVELYARFGKQINLET